jgi:GNAT superfamily N-acetyltransferase
VDDHFRPIELSITIDQFHRLPRNAAYKYEYWDGRAVLTPRPKAHACVLDLRPFDPPDRHDVRPLPAADIPSLAGLFHAAHAWAQPFQSLDRDAAAAAARDCLARTADGRDGPLIEAACFRAFEREGDGPAGAILVTLVPEAVLTEPFAGLWREPPAADAVARRLGVPHLTWVFVHHWLARRGIGTALLAAAVRALIDMGFTQMASTFALDNGPSALWHWRNGFRLLPQMSAMRRRYEGRGT